MLHSGAGLLPSSIATMSNLVVLNLDNNVLTGMPCSAKGA